MAFPSFAQFQTLASQGGNFIPVYQELVADLDTPVSAWYRLCAGQPYSFLLESVEGGEMIVRDGRYSLIGCDPLWRMETRGDQTTQIHRGDEENKTFVGDPFVALADCMASFKLVKLPELPELPAGMGGLFGYWGYELIQWIEPTVTVHPIQDGDLPDGIWMLMDRLLIYDQIKRKIWAIAYADLSHQADPKVAYDTACTQVEEMVKKLELPQSVHFLNWTPPKAGAKDASETLAVQSNFTRESFCKAVDESKDHIKAGDIFQVVISQQLSTTFEGEPFDLYRSLRLINPSPYMAFFNFQDWQIIGSSPEVMVKAKNEPGDVVKATVRPIAGTRKRGKTEAEDLELEQDLQADPKEVAEHVMLVDLGRNDLGRVCENGTVEVDEKRKMVVERYSHVMHIVSNVVGILRPDQTTWDLLKACFPAGTVSGAPKIRAMQIINQLEPTRRGVYSGVYGCYDFEKQLNSAIAIRTMVVRPDSTGKRTVSVQAGAGIVADSVPNSEYEETLNKARAVLEAIRCLQTGEKDPASNE
jgi:anthranilate synthase component I